LGNFSIVHKIGHGTFGQVFIVKSDTDGKIYAAKVEPKNTPKKTIKFESKIMRVLQRSQYVPRFIDAGSTNQGTFIIMELVGPSLVQVLKKLQKTRFSVSTGLRLSYHLLHAIEDIHNCCIIHRDLKPSNILLHNDPKHPIVIIDYGLSRIYVDTTTGKHVAPRKHPGFRGTAVFASVNAHMHMELSRRDDLISWYYVTADIMTSSLPWRRMDNRSDILYTKRHFDTASIFNSTVPELSEAWNHVMTLQYEDKPNYAKIYSLMERAMERLNIRIDDQYDWENVINTKDYSIQENELVEQKDDYVKLSESSDSDKYREPVPIQKSEENEKKPGTENGDEGCTIF
jgi:serine/threonine protein kinase